jgi:hypothetical protein
LARASDGLRLRFMNDANTTKDPLKKGPTLTALAGAGANVKPGMWGSIRTGNIDGKGGDEVLFLDPLGDGPEAWSYDPTGAGSWGRLVDQNRELRLNADPWLTKPQYYSMIQTGDVNGDGSDDVIARGPNGIRTWFWRTGGWQRYLPPGYPDFPTDAQRYAFAALNGMAQQDRVIPPRATTVRDVSASENPPQPTDLTKLRADLLKMGNCTTRVTVEPPSYQTCTPPTPNSGLFTADEGTTVVNQMLAESYYAGKVLDFFENLDDIRTDLLFVQSAVLPAIGNDLGLQQPQEPPHRQPNGLRERELRDRGLARGQRPRTGSGGAA